MYTYYENPKKHIFISHKKKTYNFASHFHSNIEIAYCFSGKQTIKIGENRYTLKGGDAAIIFPNIVHEYIEYPDSGSEQTEVIAVVVNNKLIAGAIAGFLSNSPKNPIVENELISENVRFAFKKVLDSKNDMALLGWTYIILSELLDVVTLTPSDKDLELAPKIIDYIDANFKEPLSINHLANVFGYSPSYIAHVFCDQLKIPFRTYLGSVRSEYAATLIKTTQKNLTEIAYDSGFLSLNTFCRCFKKHFFMTPSQYKKTTIRCGF